MDSHESATPMRPPGRGVDATSRPVGGDVTRRRQAEQLPEIPEFRDVEQLSDGSWRAVHIASREPITAQTLDHLVDVDAPLLRIAHGWRCVR